jgi:hypothetical protein
VERIPDSFRMFTFKNETFEKQSKNVIFGQFWPILATIFVRGQLGQLVPMMCLACKEIKTE